MDQKLFTPLNQLEASLNTLLTSLTNTNTYAAAPAATQSLLNADDALSSTLVELRQHQTNYSRILELRAEADKLQTQLRDIIRTCVDLRSEIGRIHPSILEDTDDEDSVDDEPKTPTTHKKSKVNKPVEYDTLLSFAARIGKHNAAAAVEAERQSNRRHIDATKNKPTEPNGSNTQTTQGGESAIDDSAENANNNATQESLAELAAINDTLAQQRAYRGMAFPAAEALRMGELGRLQYIREQEGESAVDKEIERMIRESEKVIAEDEPPSTKDEKDAVPVSPKQEPVSARPDIPLYTVPQQQRPPQSGPNLPPKPKKALDLDFPDSDDEDDDD